LNNSRYTSFFCNCYTVWERKKSIASHDLRLNQNQGFAFQSLEVRHQLLKFDQFRKILVFRFLQKRCVRFCVFTNFRGKYQILNFLFCGTRYSNGSDRLYCQ
jgi:hypothetical protein